MNPLTPILCIICVLSFMGCIASIVFSDEPPSPVKEGDLLGMINPGRSDDPDKKPEPFVAIEHVLEVRGGSALVERYYLNADGSTMSGKPEWEKMDGLRYARKWMGNTK